MLRAEPSGWFTWDYTVYRGGRELTRVSLSWLREKGEFALGGQAYRVAREGWLHGDFVLESEGRVLARATKPSALFRSYEVEHEGRRFTLEARHPFTHEFVLRHGDREVGRVSPAAWYSREARVELPSRLPLAVRIFVLWLVLILWRRQQNAAASGSAA